jgi:hypothetical protein
MNPVKIRYPIVLSVVLLIGTLQPLEASPEKKMLRKFDGPLSILLGSSPADASPELHLAPKTQSHYRINPHPRTYGMSQGNVGSCAAEAEVAALESAFSFRKLGVRLSTFYRHACNWRRPPTPEEGDEMKETRALTRLDLQEEDRNLLEATGPIIPDFMLPEDGEGLNTYKTGTRTNPSRIATIPSIWVNAKRLGFSERFYSLTFGQNEYSNSADLGTLKALLENGSAITLSINLEALICLQLKERTGEVEEIYRKEKVEKCLKAPLSKKVPHHAVAVLGFDDSYYQHLGGSGALFIRNSHNNNEVISTTDEADQERPKSKLIEVGKFKQQTLLNENHPGYYAIPYEFLRDSFPMNFFKIIDLDFDAFASMYQKFRPLYQIQYVPFACEEIADPHQDLSPAQSALQHVMELKSSSLDQKNFEKTWNEILQEESSTRSSTDSTVPKFQIAKLSIGPVGPLSLEADRALEFRQNKFSQYYCPPRSRDGQEYLRGVWPGATFYSELAEVQDRLSESPYSYSAWDEYLKKLIQLGVPNETR